jgi:hypothetical protein
LFNKDFLVERKSKKGTVYKRLLEMIDLNFVQMFMEHNSLVLRSPQGKPMVSPEKQRVLDQLFFGNCEEKV